MKTPSSDGSQEFRALASAAGRVRIAHHANAVSPTQADVYLGKLRNEIEWQQGHVQMFGKRIAEPRLSAWYGTGGATYRYSGVTRHPLALSETLLELKTLAEAFAMETFNSCLANLYRDGADSMGWHSDDEPELGDEPIIASLSFGETRRFCLRHRATREKREFALGHGSLLVMDAGTQERWQHSVPKTKRPKGERINLTFRKLLF